MDTILIVGRKPQLMEQYMVIHATIHQCTLAGMAYTTLMLLTYGLQREFSMVPYLIHQFQLGRLVIIQIICKHIAVC